TCRSPMAEGIAKAIFPQALKEEIEISSAGSSALEGFPASAHAIQVAKKHGIDLTKHKARLLNRSLVTKADLIVTMSTKHKQMVGILDPSALKHTYLLSGFCGCADSDVPDPIGGGIEVYEQTFCFIEKCMDAMKDRLNELIAG
ncbi:MAG: low molecular weight protein arginine phosphatase, partial [Candidatus Latescibacterota bacterium]